MMSMIGPVQSHYREAVQSVKEIYGGKDLLKGYVLRLEWKSEGVMDDENVDDERDELRSGWGGELNLRLTGLILDQAVVWW